jgi:hypothetical protein
MDTQIIQVYCLCDDLLKAMPHCEDSQCQLSDAEVMTVAIVAALNHGGNFVKAGEMLSEHGYIAKMLGRSRFNRRLHRVKHFLLSLFACLGEHFKAINEESVYLIDTFPIAACDNYRIPHSKRYRGESYRGYQASKKRYFYGLKVHLLVTADSQPIEFFLTPGSTGDVEGLELFDFDLPVNSQIIGDKAYNDYELEDILCDADLHLMPMRKSNSKRPFPPWTRFLQAHFRKAVETTGSLLERILPKSIHSVTAEGFELKLVLFILAVSISRLPSCG